MKKSIITLTTIFSVFLACSSYSDNVTYYLTIATFKDGKKVFNDYRKISSVRALSIIRKYGLVADKNISTDISFFFEKAKTVLIKE